MEKAAGEITFVYIINEPRQRPVGVQIFYESLPFPVLLRNFNRLARYKMQNDGYKQPQDAHDECPIAPYEKRDHPDAHQNQCRNAVHHLQHLFGKAKLKQPKQIEQNQGSTQISCHDKQQLIVRKGGTDPKGKQIVDKMCAAAGKAPDAHQAPVALTPRFQHGCAERPAYQGSKQAQYVKAKHSNFFIVNFKKLLHAP